MEERGDGVTKARVPMVGKTFGRLTVVEQVPAPAGVTGREAWYRCTCQCGGGITTRGTSLRRGITQSCGCLRREVTQARNQTQAAQRHDLTGQRFHRLVVEGVLPQRQGGQRVWLCRCDCGRQHQATTGGLRSGGVKSCGCLPTRVPDDLTGQRFGRLTVLALTEARGSNGGAVWQCQCDCGAQCQVPEGNLRQGRTVSCGCVRREDLTGQRFGKLVVCSLGNRSNAGAGAFWNCQCDCGKMVQVHAHKLKCGHTRSCGCAHQDGIRDLQGQRFGKRTVLKDSGQRRAGRGILWRCRCQCGQEKLIRQDALVAGRTRSCGCTTSRGNEKIARMLTQGGIAFVAEYTPGDLPGRYRFDFAVFRQEKLAYLIAYDGVLHTTYSGRGWDTEARFLRTQASDGLKNAYCARKGIPLLRIPHTQYALLSLSDLVLETSPFRLSPPGPGGDAQGPQQEQAGNGKGEVVGERGHVPHHCRQGTEEEGGEELGQVQGGRQQGQHGGGGVLPRPAGGLGDQEGDAGAVGKADAGRPQQGAGPAPQEGQQEVAHQEEQGGEDLGASPQHPLDADEEQPAEEGH